MPPGCCCPALHLLENCLLELTLNLLSIITGCGLAVEGEERTEVELRRLEKLDLSYVNLMTSLAMSHAFSSLVPTYVLKRVDALASLLDLTTDHFRDELLHKLIECAA